MESNIVVVVHETEDATCFTPRDEDGSVIEDAWDADVMSELEQLDFVKEVVVEEGHLGVLLDVERLVGVDSESNHDALNALLLKALDKSEGEVSFLRCDCMEIMPLTFGIKIDLGAMSSSTADFSRN